MAAPRDIAPWVYFLASAILLSGGWLISAFPLLIAFGIAPLFALTLRVKDLSQVWEKMEWVLAGLALSFLAAQAFQMGAIVSSVFYGIGFTLPFVAYVWVRQVLGSRVGLFIIIPFWLTLEYLLVKFRPDQSIYLADSLALQMSFYAWDVHTGYLGVTLWILVANLAVYQALLSPQAFQWPWITFALVILLVPPAYGLSLKTDALNRADMIRLYNGSSESIGSVYLARGEWISRTSAWLSTLILLFTLVKSQTVKR